MMSLFLKRRYDIFLSFILIITYLGIYGLNYRSGVDWFAYEAQYYNQGWLNFELGYEILQTLFYKANISFWTFSFVVKSFFWFSCFQVTKKFSTSIAAPLFFLMMLSPIFLTDVLRQLIASGIILLSLVHITPKSFLKFSIAIVIASLFHVSALLIWPFFFIYKYSLIRLLFFIVVIFFFFIGFTNLSPIYEFVLILGTFISGPFYNKLLIYTTNQPYPMTLGHIVRFLFLIIFYISFKNRINHNFKTKVIWCALLITIGYEMVFYDISTLWTRLQEYLLVFLPIAALAFTNIIKNSKILIFTLLLGYSSHAFLGLKNNELLWRQYGSYCNYIYLVSGGCSNYPDKRYYETLHFWENRSFQKRQ